MDGAGRRIDSTSDERHIRKKLKLGANNYTDTSNTVCIEAYPNNDLVIKNSDGSATFSLFDRGQMSFPVDTGIASEVDLIPEAIESVSEKGFTITSSSTYSTTYKEELMYDRQDSTRWASGASTFTTGGGHIGAGTTTVDGGVVAGEWNQIQLPNVVYISQYKISSVNSGNTPDNWTLAGSNDGTTWFAIDKKTGQAGTYVGNIDSLPNLAVDTPSFTRYIRLIIEKVDDAGTCMVREAQFFGRNDIINVEKRIFVDGPYTRFTGGVHVEGELTTGEPHLKNICIGENVTCGTDNNVAVGTSSNTSTLGVAVGSLAIAKGSSVAIGYDAECTGGSSATVGAFSYSNADGVSVGREAGAETKAVAVGRTASSQAESVSVGYNSNCFGTDAVAVGKSSSAASLSVSIGSLSQSDGKNSVLIGADTYTNTFDYCIGVGYDAHNTTANEMMIGSSNATYAPTVVVPGRTNHTDLGRSSNRFKDVVCHNVQKYTSTTAETLNIGHTEAFNRYDTTVQNISFNLPLISVFGEGKTICYINEGTINQIQISPSGSDTINFSGSAYNIPAQSNKCLTGVGTNWIVS